MAVTGALKESRSKAKKQKNKIPAPLGGGDNIKSEKITGFGQRFLNLNYLMGRFYKVCAS
jgi:hypothetical protein